MVMRLLMDAISQTSIFLQETDQLAAITLTERRADVAMYIAIDGIPAGEKITYILPFWYPPCDFIMEEMPSGSFQELYTAPISRSITHHNEYARGYGSQYILESTLSFGLHSLPWFQQLSQSRKGFPLTAASAVSGQLQPYAIQETQHARAELYHIQEKDLQQLISQSGLPAKYLAPLQKYAPPISR